MHINDELLVIGYPVCKLPLSKRAYVADGGLRCSVAWCMGRLADVKRGDVVCDCMCGAGTVSLFCMLCLCVLCVVCLWVLCVVYCVCVCCMRIVYFCVVCLYALCVRGGVQDCMWCRLNFCLCLCACVL